MSGTLGTFVTRLPWVPPPFPSCEVGGVPCPPPGGGRSGVRVGSASVRPPGMRCSGVAVPCPLGLQPSSSTLPCSHTKYKTIHGHRRAWATSDPLGQSWGSGWGPHHSPGPEERDSTGYSDDTERLAACPTVLFWKGAFGNVLAWVTPDPLGDVLWAAIRLPVPESGSVSESPGPGGRWSLPPD